MPSSQIIAMVSPFTDGTGQGRCSGRHPARRPPASYKQPSAERESCPAAYLRIAELPTAEASAKQEQCPVASADENARATVFGPNREGVVGPAVRVKISGNFGS